MSALKLNLGNVAAAAAANTAPGTAGALNARDDNAAAQRERAFGDLLSHSGSHDSQAGAGKATHTDLHTGHHKPSGDAAHDALVWVANSRATAAGLHAHPAAEAAVAAAHAMPPQKASTAKSGGIDAVGGGARRGETSHAATARPPSSQDRTRRDGVVAGSNGGSGKPAAIEGDRSACAPAPVAPGADEAPRAGDAAPTDTRRQSLTAANTGTLVLAADTAASASTSAEAPLDTSGSPTSTPALAGASGTGAAAVPFSAADTSAPAAATAPPTLALTPTNAPAAPSAPGDVRGDGMRLGLVATIKPLVTNATIPAGPATTALDPTALPVAARITLTDTAPAAASASDATSAAFIAATAAAVAVAGATAKTAAAAQSSTSADAAMAATGANPSANDTTSLAQALVADAAIAASGPTLTAERAAALSDVFASTPFGAALEKTGPRRDTDTTAAFDIRSAASAVAGAIGPSGSTPQTVGMLDAKTAVPAVHDPQFADALGSRLSWLAERHIGSAQISLSPAALGPLDVRVHVSGERVRAEFASNHAGVRDAITAHVPRLRELLAQRGFTLTDAQVGSGHAHAQPKTAAPSTPAHASDADGSAITTAGEPAPTLRVAHDGLIDAFA